MHPARGAATHLIAQLPGQTSPPKAPPFNKSIQQNEIQVVDFICIFKIPANDKHFAKYLTLECHRA